MYGGAICSVTLCNAFYLLYRSLTVKPDISRDKSLVVFGIIYRNCLITVIGTYFVLRIVQFYPTKMTLYKNWKKKYIIEFQNNYLINGHLLAVFCCFCDKTMELKVRNEAKKTEK